MSRTLQGILLICAVANLAFVAWDVATGGIYFSAFGVIFSSWELSKPIRYATVCFAGALWLRDRTTVRPSWENIAAWAPRAAAWIAVSVAVTGVLFGARAAGGADVYGYVSESKLWLDARLIQDDPLAPLTPHLGLAAAPVGYTLAATGSGTAPIYPPGLPLAMAFARVIAGSRAVYLVVPLLAGVAVWMTFLVGARVTDERTGLVAAALLACNPLFLFHALLPMSDVPATAFWTMAWAMLLLPQAAGAFGAGVASAAAILTRPNLTPLAAIVAAAAAGSRPRGTRLVLFAVPVAAACVFVGRFNDVLYGSPLFSGYGPASALYSSANFGSNLVAYSRWLRDLCSTILVLALFAPWLRRSRWIGWMLVFSAGVVLSYLFYLVWTDWPFARFMLPAVPLLLVSTAITILHAMDRVTPKLRSVTLLLICGLLIAHYQGIATRIRLFDVRGNEERYRTIGEYVGRTLPAHAIVFTTVHSGSVRLYANRPTIRWTALPPDGLDRAVSLVRGAGYTPYFLLEDWELRDFRKYFAAANVLGGVEWPARAEYSGANHAHVYAVDDRDRHVKGDRIDNLAMPLPK